MTTRTAALRALFEPHFPVFAAEHRAALLELLRLAEVGERAQALLATFSVTAKPAPPAAETSAPRPATNAKKAERSKASRPKPTRAKKQKASAKAPKKARSAKAQSEGGPTLRDTILRVLSDAKKPLPLAEIEAAVKATGYTSASKAFSKVLGHTITMMKKELRRAGRGVYGLA